MEGLINKTYIFYTEEQVEEDLSLIETLNEREKNALKSVKETFYGRRPIEMSNNDVKYMSFTLINTFLLEDYYELELDNYKSYEERTEYIDTKLQKLQEDFGNRTLCIFGEIHKIITKWCI